MFECWNAGTEGSDSPEVPAEPDGGEVSPAELPGHLVPGVEDVPDVDWMVAACRVTQLIIPIENWTFCQHRIYLKFQKKLTLKLFAKILLLLKDSFKPVLLTLHVVSGLLLLVIVRVQVLSYQISTFLAAD